MKTLTSISMGALLLATGCAQPAARAPQAPPPPPPAPPCACDAMHGPPGGGRMAWMHHGAGPMGPVGPMGAGPMGPMGAGPMGPGRMGPMRGELAWRMHERGMSGGWGGGGDQEVMRELARLGVRFYPPQMLLRRSAEIGLTSDQIAKIRREVLSTQARAVDLRGKAEKAKIEAMRLLTADKVDEHAVGAQIDEAAKARADLRKVQLGMMLHVRALLTPDQIKKLDALRPGPRGGPAFGPGPQAAADDDDAGS